MKKKLIVLLMFIPLLFSNCDDSDQAPDVSDESVKVYMDYGSIEISKSNISKILDFDEEIIDVVEEDNVFVIKGKKEGSTLLQASDIKGMKKKIHVSVFLVLNVNRWSFDNYSVDIDCADPGLRENIMADLGNHIVQCRESGNNLSSIIFISPNIFDMEMYAGGDSHLLNGYYKYDLTNLFLSISSEKIMTCRFSDIEELPMSWNATLTHDLTESYKAMYPGKVNKVMVNYSVSAAKILLGHA